MRLKDLALEPYEIEIENPDSFILISLRPILQGKDAGKMREIQEGYYTSIAGVVNKLVKIKQADKNKHAEEQVMTLQQFLNDYARFSNQFSTLMAKALGTVGIKAEVEKL